MPPGASSRYLFCEGIDDGDGKTYLTTADPFRYRDLSDNIEHVCVESDTLWGIAGTYYAELARDSNGSVASGTSGAQLYWVIADFNDIADPTLTLAAGTRLWVPSPRTVTEEILAEVRRFEAQD